MIKKVLIGIVATIILVIIAAEIYVYNLQGPEIPQGQTDLRFTEVTVGWMHKSDQKKSLPFGAIAAIDINNDHIDEIFAGGGIGQADALLKFDGEKFIAVEMDGLTKSADDATMGAVSMDVTADGYTDLFVARESGVWFYTNTGEDGATVFSGHLINVALADNTTPLSITIGDINNDGWADLYVSGYIKNGMVEGETIFNQAYGGYSYLLLNNGDNTWKDISKSAGVWRQHNTFTASFIDLDNDLDSDLVIAQDTGKVEMYTNNGDLTFSVLKNPSVFSYPMGLGAGDFNNDGLMDLYFSNVGNTLPRSLLIGDLREDQPFNMDYMLFKNDGKLEFSDVAAPMDVAKLGFGWGVVLQDMDMDSHSDILIAQNYGRFPGVEYLDPYSGRLMLQQENAFVPVEEVSGAANKFFGLSPVVSDFNQDGWPDIVWMNLNGPLRAMLSEGIPDRNWLTVRLADVPASVGALITVTLPDGRTLTDQFITGEGLSSDQTPDLHFGLDGVQSATVTVQYQSGQKEVREVASVNTVVEFN